MTGMLTEKLGKHGRERLFRTGPRVPDVSVTEAVCRHFREQYPMLLDGALPQVGDRTALIRHARESLARGRVNPAFLPAAILRETLEAVTGAPGSAAGAGLVPVGPNAARVWWDASVLDNLDDVLARLERPRPILRFYDVTDLDPDSGRWHAFHDIDVELDEQGRTVELCANDRVYVVDLGYEYADGRFLRLARSNTAALPRGGKGRPDDGRTSRSLLRSRVRPHGVIAPDARAREWVDAARDHADRDIEAELTVHMLYRAFLREGPRALRRSPRFFRRDREVLHREYAQRVRARGRRCPANGGAAPGFLVARLDPATPVRIPHGESCLPALVVARPVIHTLAQHQDITAFAWFSALVSCCLNGSRDATRNPAGMLAQSPVERVDSLAVAEKASSSDSLVRTLKDGGDVAMPFMASPVFAAARTLRENLSRIRSLGDELSDTATSRDELEHALAKTDAEEVTLNFGGSEGKRMAKAGVRITRMALTLEGRMRPGAKLKVAGKLVHADADGCFRLECVLTGRRSSIPMRAGASIGGEARSMINVEWEKRFAREKKTAGVK